MSRLGPHQTFGPCELASGTGLLNWMIAAALPLWADRGVDPVHGGFHDLLCPDTLQNRGQKKRLRVTARQIYVFTVAETLGFAGSRETANHGLDFLLGPCANSDGSFTSELSLLGSPIQGAIDLYDNAFAVFALAKAYGNNPDQALHDAATKAQRYISATLSHPCGGFAESAPPRLPRRQNPHMHLLEAALAWLDVRPNDPLFAEVAQHMIDLFNARLFQADSGLVAEFYGDDWRPESIVAEPGHHFEWVWLLHQARRHDLANVIVPEQLRTLARRYGLNPRTGLLYGEIGSDYRATGTEVRLWPHAEWLRAEATMGHYGETQRAAGALARFLDHPVKGLWYETFDHNLGFQPDNVPASSLYHIVGGIEALVQLSPGAVNR